MVREHTQYDFSHSKFIETCFVLCGQFCQIFYVFEENMYFSVSSFLVTKVNGSYFLTYSCPMNL